MVRDRKCARERGGGGWSTNDISVNALLEVQKASYHLRHVEKSMLLVDLEEKLQT